MNGVPLPGILHLRQASGVGGGADTVLRQLAVRAQRSAHLNTRVAYLHKPHADVAPLTDLLAAADVPVHDVPGHALLDLRQLRSLLQLVDRHRIALLHSHDHKSNAATRLVASLRPGIRTVSTLHGWTAAHRKGRLYERLDQFLLRGFDHCLAVSEATRERAEAGGLRRVEVLLNGVDTARWSPGPVRNEADFTVGFVGRLSAEKAPLDLIRAAARLRDRTGHVRFLIAGDGPLREQAAALIASEGLAGRVELLGALTPERMPGFYRRLDAIALTSLTEGTPMVLLEAGAMGLPAVATRVGGVPAVVADGESGFLVDSGDVAGLAERLGQLSGDRELARRLGAQARERVRRGFSIDATWERLESLYRELIGGAVPETVG